MKTIVLIACSKTKTNHPCVAAKLYTSPLFRMSLEYAQKLQPDSIFILSAKYGLLTLDTPIVPYNKTLATMPDASIRAWSAKVLEQLRSVGNLKDDQYVILAGQQYYKYLIPQLGHWSLPLEHLGLGKRLAFLKNHI